MDYILSFFATASLSAIALFLLLMLLCLIAWAVLFAQADPEEVEELQEALREADDLRTQAEDREVKLLREIKRLRDALRIHEAA